VRATGKAAALGKEWQLEASAMVADNCSVERDLRRSFREDVVARPVEVMVLTPRARGRLAP
jgi:hypothetical protein